MGRSLDAPRVTGTQLFSDPKSKSVAILHRKFFLFSNRILNYLSPLKTPTNPTITMKWIICTVACLAFFAATNAELVEEDGEARLGFISVGSGGDTTLTFNATSIQNAIILGLFILVLGALVLPLFGVSVAEEETGYGYEQPAYAYDEAAAQVGYAKRSVDSVGPVLAAM